MVISNYVTGLADKSHSFLTFLTYCRKFGDSLLYISHEPALSSPRSKDIFSQMQIFCVFRSAMYLVLNHLVKVVTRGTNTTGYVSRQQLWLTNCVRTLKKQSVIPVFVSIKDPKCLEHQGIGLRWKTPRHNTAI